MGSKRLTEEEKAKRAEERSIARQKAREDAENLKEFERIQARKNQKPVARIVITVEWKSSRTWGSNPHASYQVQFKDGSWGRNKKDITCGGCGSDKLSTVIAEIFNELLAYKLYRIKKEKKVPYGICNHGTSDPYYGGGIGIGCYSNISTFIGGEFRGITETKSVDVFEYIAKERR